MKTKYLLTSALLCICLLACQGRYGRNTGDNAGSWDTNRLKNPAHYQAAAERGDVVSQYTLGMMYLKGQGVAKDLAAARKWFRNAVDMGFAPAQFRLGQMG
jgi:TPR repeat protein